MTEREIFIAALQKEGPAQRQAYLDEACAGQPELRRQVEDLLRLYEGAGSFLEKAAAEAMRRILVDNARRKQSQKRGGAGAPAQRARLDLDQLAATSERLDEVLDIDAALAGLADADPQAAELVKLRYFAGLSIPQAAAALGVSPRSADFLWAYARAWLLRFLGGADAQP